MSIQAALFVGLFSAVYADSAWRSSLWQMLQQRLILSRLEREREGGVIFLGSLNHTVLLNESALRYLSAYAPVWHSIGDDPFQCRSGPRGNPTNNKGHQVGWWSCSSQKSADTCALPAGAPSFCAQ